MGIWWILFPVQPSAWTMAVSRCPKVAINRKVLEIVSYPGQEGGDQIFLRRAIVWASSLCNISPSLPKVLLLLGSLLSIDKTTEKSSSISSQTIAMLLQIFDIHICSTLYRLLLSTGILFQRWKIPSLGEIKAQKYGNGQILRKIAKIGPFT